jgi:hypothetical protein
MSRHVPMAYRQRTLAWRGTVWIVLLCAAAACVADAQRRGTRDSVEGHWPGARPASNRRTGRRLQVANLVYAGSRAASAFRSSRIRPRLPRFQPTLHAEIADTVTLPLLIMTGEGTFTLTDQERENLRRYIEWRILLASAGSSQESARWRELASISFSTAEPAGHGPSRIPHRAGHQRVGGQARHTAPRIAKAVSRSSIRRRTERYRAHARLLLLWWKRNQFGGRM